MKALSLFLALHAALSSGDQWNPYTKLYANHRYYYSQPLSGHRDRYYKGHFDNGVLSPVFLPPLNPSLIHRLDAQVTGNNVYPTRSNVKYVNSEPQNTNNVLNLLSKSVNKNSGGHENIPTRRMHNNLWHSRRPLAGHMNVNQGFKKVNNYIYFINKTDAGDQQPTEVYPRLPVYIQNQPDLRLQSPNSPYWINENYHKQRLWVPLQQSWVQQHGYFPPNPVDVTPQPNVDTDWSQPDPYRNECYNLVGIISDLRSFLQKNNISEEKQSLRTLYKIIKMFILKNNLQNAPFSVVVREIAAVLLNENNDENNLTEDEVVEILQRFKNYALYNLLREIRGDPNVTLQDVVYRLAQVLFRLKEVLVRKGYSEHSVKVVINRAVRLSVPLVGYYFEKECKIKTQQYIVQRLELVLNVKLEDEQQEEGLDASQTDLGLASPLGSDDGDNSNYDGQGVGGNLLSPGIIVTPSNLGDLGLGSSGSLGNLGGVESVTSAGSLGSLGEQNLEDQGIQELLGDSGKLVSSGLWNSEALGNQDGLGAVTNQAHPAGL